MLPVLNHLVRSAHFMTKSVPRQMFTTLGLDDRGLDHYQKVAHDLICKAFNVANEGSRLPWVEEKAVERLKKVSFERINVKQEQDNVVTRANNEKTRADQLQTKLNTTEKAQKKDEEKVTNTETELTSKKAAKESAEDKLGGEEKELCQAE